MFSPGSSGPGDDVAEIVVEPFDEGPWSLDCWFVSTDKDGGEGEALLLTDADVNADIRFFAALAGEL